MSPNKKPNKTVLFIIAFILGSMFLFCFLIFETSAIYDVDISNYYNLNQEVHRPISVSDIQRQIDMADKGIVEGSDSSVDLGHIGTLPSVGGGTGSSVINPDDPNNSVIVTPVPGGSGSKAGRICSNTVYVYDGPTVNSTGSFISTQEAFADHGKALQDWATIEWTSPSNVSSGVAARLNNPHADSLGVYCGDVEGINGVTERYAVALGPNIMNPAHVALDVAVADEMHYGTAVDVVLQKGNKRFYVPAVVADCSAHTYPSGIVHTGYKPEGGGDLTYVDANGNTTLHATYDADTANNGFGTAGAIEFVSVPGTQGCRDYELIGVIVY